MITLKNSILPLVLILSPGFSQALELEGVYNSIEVLLSSKDDRIRKQKQSIEDLSKVLPNGGEIEFTKDIIFEPQGNGYYKSWSLRNATIGHLGINKNSDLKYFMFCDFQLTVDESKRRFLENKTVLKIASTDLLFRFNYLGRLSHIYKIRINFAHAAVESMNCEAASDFTGLDSIPMTAATFIKGASAFMKSSNFVIPKGSKL